MKRKIERSSMLNWWPLIRNLNIPMPKTVVQLVNPRIAYRYVDGKGHYDMKKLKDRANEIGYPLFVRTDEVSGKHEWKDMCYVKCEDDLQSHIYALMEYSLCVDIFGLDVNAFFFREYVEMDSGYKAFGGMPVNPERRYFIKNGKVLCHHPYWFEGAIQRPDNENWKELSREMNIESKEEVKLLMKYAEEVAILFPNECWSVDFCKSKTKKWYLIDMAIGSKSWHPEDCSFIMRVENES